ncbi:hypothetical protein [Rubrivirga litoralis]|uniref:Uncharacterized protein n=1 Tax=Rubrivirga litoralis TaxID=3075598 RepID=A0ABU3BSD1_9BACT|nr:hypothetical protein [Rubrivirga sp. F394]MDT0632193.1 hypothetical protein [Rubrivirga sp. F394]
MADDTPRPDGETAPPDATPATAPPNRPALRAGRPLDLSTGKAPSKPPPKPVRFVPLPAPEGAPEVKVGRTVDFSTGKAGAPPRRKSAAASLGPGPIVRKTVDLSTETPRPAPSEMSQGEASAEARPAKRKRKRSGGSKAAKGGATSSGGASRGRGGSGGPPDKGKPSGPASSATSLADLLDPETLARLRGDG